jgi:hypothetical protein
MKAFRGSLSIACISPDMITSRISSLLDLFHNTVTMAKSRDALRKGSLSNVYYFMSSAQCLTTVDATPSNFVILRLVGPQLEIIASSLPISEELGGGASGYGGDEDEGLKLEFCNGFDKGLKAEGIFLIAPSVIIMLLAFLPAVLARPQFPCCHVSVRP